MAGDGVEGRDREQARTPERSRPAPIAAPLATLEARLPLVSVVVPAYNCQRTLPRCLSSLKAQTYPSERVELIVVDDGSTDATAARAAEAIRDWDGAWEGAFQLVRQANGGPARARNAGIRAAHGTIVAFIDADCAAAHDWLRQLVACLEAHSEVAGVGGPLEIRTSGSLVASYLRTTAFYHHRLRGNRVEYLLTQNAGFRREALRHVGGFADQGGAWCEDADLSFRLRNAGYSLLLAQRGSVSILEGPHSVHALARQLFRYGRGNAVLSRRWHNGRTPAVELLRHSGAVALSPLLALRWASRVGLGRALAFCPLIAVEHSAFVCGLAAGMLRGRWGGHRDGSDGATGADVAASGVGADATGERGDAGA